MIISYKNNKIKKICEDAQQAEKNLGSDGACKLKTRLVELQAFPLKILLRDRVGGCHRLTGDRKGQIAMSLKEPFRLIFTVKNSDTAIVIDVSSDYH